MASPIHYPQSPQTAAVVETAMHSSRAVGSAVETVVEVAVAAAVAAEDPSPPHHCR